MNAIIKISIFLLLLLPSCAISGSVDFHYPYLIHRLGFGSCAKQYRPTSSRQVWTSVAALKPDAWLWTGDAVYPQKSGVSELQHSYERQLNATGYAEFAKSVEFVDGVIDDHDYGVNDGDKHNPIKEKAQKFFLDFLGIDENSTRRHREGTYFAHLYGEEGNKNQIKVIGLDTRYHRDSNYIPSVGRYRVKGLPVVAAFIRMLTSFVGLGHDYNGDMLGERQWEWLEDQLSESTAAIHILISGVQITTTLSIVESWGHYPVARRRLFDLLQKTNPRGLIFVSGDVHFAQILGDESGVVELTSSGLTHSVVEQGVLWALTEAFLLPFHRSNQFHVRDGCRLGFYEGRNFGMLDFSFGHVEGQHNVSTTTVLAKIFDVQGEERLHVQLTFRSDDDPSIYLSALNDVPPLIPKRSAVNASFRIFLLWLPVWWGVQILYLIFGKLNRNVTSSGKKKQ